MRLVPGSLRNRLVLGAAAVGLAFAVLFGATATWRVHHAEDQAVRAALQTRVELARDQVAADGSLTQDAGSPKTDLVQVIAPDGTIRSASPALTGAPPLVDLTTVLETAHGGRTSTSLQRPDTELAVLAVPIELARSGASDAGTGALAVAVDAEGFNTATANLLELLIGGLLVVVVAITVLAWMLTGRALTSVTRLTEAAEAVDAKDLADGLPVPRRDAELTRLVAALNRMLARLHSSHATELAFAADAGHRLRTPVATLRAEAELALREGDPAELTAALERIMRDADQLTSIVDRMLARSRSRDHAPEPVLCALEEAGSRWRRRAQLASVELSVDIDGRITPDTCCAELVEVIEPVLDNATRFTPAGGAVHIAVRWEDATSDCLVVDISNTGFGVSREVAPHLFDAWVSSRDASVAGGLGLWLARETARDLGGDVRLVDGPPHTTVFRVELPTSTTS